MLDGELMDNGCVVLLPREEEVDSRRVDNLDDEATAPVGGDVLGRFAELPPMTCVVDEETVPLTTCPPLILGLRYWCNDKG